MTAPAQPQSAHILTLERPRYYLRAVNLGKQHHQGRLAQLPEPDP